MNFRQYNISNVSSLFIHSLLFYICVRKTCFLPSILGKPEFELLSVVLITPRVSCSTIFTNRPLAWLKHRTNCSWDQKLILFCRFTSIELYKSCRGTIIQFLSLRGYMSAKVKLLESLERFSTSSVQLFLACSYFSGSSLLQGLSCKVTQVNACSRNCVQAECQSDSRKGLKFYWKYSSITTICNLFQCWKRGICFTMLTLQLRIVIISNLI